MIKKIVGVSIIVLINFLFLFLLELGLRVFNAGISTHFLLEKEIDNEAYLHTNMEFANQYFPKLSVTVPTPNIEFFPKEKSKEVYRIYVIGESTSRGFPYTKLEAFPRQLQQILNQSRAGKFEVFNFSMDATNSHTGLDIVKQVTDYPPDLAIIYYGHNEFIGVGGSTEQRNFFFRANKLFSKLRFYQLIKKLLSKEKESSDLLGEMARKRRIDIDTELYEETIKDFETNYKSILNELSNAGIKIITCGVAKNLKDFKPANNISLLKPEKDMLLSISDDEKAKKYLRKISGDGKNIYFNAGRILLDKRREKLARYCFIKSCDLDNLRLRASSDINNVIERLAKEKNCLYLNFQKKFDEVDLHGIAGDEYFLEHVHPMLKGHNLMARHLAETILENEFDGYNREFNKRIRIRNSIVNKISVVRICYNLYTKYPLLELNYINKNGLSAVYKTGNISLKSPEFINDSVKNIYNVLDPLFQKYGSIDLVHQNYAKLLFDKNELNGSYYEYSLAYDINPLNMQPLSNMAYIRYLGGDKKTALEMQDWVYKVAPDYEKGLSNYYVMLKNEKKHKKAKEIEKQLKKLKVNID